MKTRFWRRAGFVAFVAASIAYLVWRIGWSFNPAAPVYSWLFFGLETYALLSSLMFYWVILEPFAPRVTPPPPGLDVDVFICTYNEPVELVRQTARRAAAMDYPHRTWILDDGKREGMRALAEELGVQYLTREKNEHFKAGNLNNALGHTSGDFVVVLDADHLVRQDFLTSLLGYFRDPDVALVQTPQVYYNVDSFQHHLDAKKNRLWHEGAIFHHSIQSGLARWNESLFTGSGAVVRRSALEEIGGFAVGSVTEDVYTSMRFHAAGYKTVHHDEPLGYLLAPESLVQYLTQRLRWGQGAMQILRMENPVLKKGLSFRQRLIYLNAFSAFSQALVHLAFYLAPAIFLLGGPAPIKVGRVVDFAPLLAHIVIDLAMFKLFVGALARPILAECYKLFNLYVYIKALGGFFKKGRLKFRVTTKGADGGASLMLLAPQAAIVLLNVTATGIGVLRLSAGNFGAIGALGYGVATFFSTAFALVGGMAFLFAYRRIVADSDYVIPDQIPARLSAGEGAVAESTVVRINDEKAFVLCDGELGEDQPVALSLDLGDGAPPLEVSGTAVESARSEDGFVVQVALEPLPAETWDRLFDRFARVSMPKLVNRLVEEWSEARPRRRLESAPAYLPMEPNVL